MPRRHWMPACKPESNAITLYAVGPSFHAHVFTPAPAGLLIRSSVEGSSPLRPTKIPRGNQRFTMHLRHFLLGGVSVAVAGFNLTPARELFMRTFLRYSGLAF